MFTDQIFCMTTFKTPVMLIPVIVLTLACGSNKKAATPMPKEIIVGEAPAPSGGGPKVIEPVRYASLQNKYANIMNLAPEQITNIKLYHFIDTWMYTPYKWGGTDRSGIDCSAFMQRLLDTAYNIRIPRTSIEQFFANWIDRFASTKHLSEGDLVFFKTIGENVVSHVGLYLSNGWFVNSSSSKGVSLARLDDKYWRKRYVAAGRVKLSMISSSKSMKK